MDETGLVIPSSGGWWWCRGDLASRAAVFGCALRQEGQWQSDPQGLAAVSKAQEVQSLLWTQARGCPPAVSGYQVRQAGESEAAECAVAHIAPMCAAGCRSRCVLAGMAQ